MDPIDLSPQQRAARVVWLLALGRPLTTGQVAELTGLQPRGARKLMAALSAIVPIRREGDAWRSCSPGTARGYGSEL